MAENSEPQPFSEELFRSEDLGDDTNKDSEETPMESEEMRDTLVDEIENNMEQEEGEAVVDEEEENTEEQPNEDDEGEAKENTKATKKAPASSTHNRITELPLAKIKHIIKLDPEVKLVSNEATFIIAKSTELFIKSLAKEAFGFAAQNRKKTIAKGNVDSALGMLPVEL